MPPSQSSPTEWHCRGYLPHRDRIHLIQSVTFRLADSLPQSKLKALEAELDGLNEKGKEVVWDREHEKRIRIEAFLDAGMGCCALGNDAMAEVMQKALLKFHSERYELLAWCIMPNHVHALVDPWMRLSKIVQSWKSYTGRWAMQHNAELELGVPGGSKSFWMRDYWDRYIRSEVHLKNVIDYIHQNPVKAGLCLKAEDWKWSSCGCRRERRAPARQRFS